MDVQDWRKKQQKEVDANYKVFKKLLPDLMGRHTGKHALMKDREVVNFYDTSDQAFNAGKRRFKDGVFSVQKVSDEVLDFRMWRHALPH